MQRAMRTVLEWPQNHATRKTINMITNKYEPYQSLLHGDVSVMREGGWTVTEPAIIDKSAILPDYLNPTKI